MRQFFALCSFITLGSVVAFAGDPKKDFHGSIQSYWTSDTIKVGYLDAASARDAIETLGFQIVEENTRRQFYVVILSQNKKDARQTPLKTLLVLLSDPSITSISPNEDVPDLSKTVPLFSPVSLDLLDDKQRNILDNFKASPVTLAAEVVDFNLGAVSESKKVTFRMRLDGTEISLHSLKISSVGKDYRLKWKNRNGDFLDIYVRKSGAHGQIHYGDKDYMIGAIGGGLHVLAEVDLDPDKMLIELEKLRALRK